MNKDEVLDEIFGNDPFDLLKVKPKAAVRTSDDRLSSSFQEINEFVAKNGREPEPNVGNVSEFQLYSRLKNLRGDDDKVAQLKAEDEYKLLPHLTTEQLNEAEGEYQKQLPKEISSIDDIFGDDIGGILGGDDEGLFDFKHTPKDFERAEADFVARRKPCKDFDNYEEAFREVQQALANGKRKLIPFKQENLRPGDYYVHNGVLLLLEKVDFEEDLQEFSSGKRVRKDGRTKTIFENGTESNMLYRSLYKIILANGKSVTQNTDEIKKGFMEKFGAITQDDTVVGHIYVLRSKSSDERISSLSNLYKIGYSNNDVAQRIKNASNQPTYLMADVEYIAGWKCYNMKTQKFEDLIHKFFAKVCLDIDVFDDKGIRHSPREWFIAPLEVIEQAISLIISGDVIEYRYDNENQVIIPK